jgi:hypothetical protein
MDQNRMMVLIAIVVIAIIVVAAIGFDVLRKRRRAADGTMTRR